MIPFQGPQRQSADKRVLVSAPRPDSVMLRRRSLREAGRMLPAPRTHDWRNAGWLDLAPEYPGRLGLE